MTQGIRDGEPDARILYADIIDLPHYHVPGRPYMDDFGRSAQFSAFNALEGYEEMVDEEARVVGDKIALTEMQKESLKQKLTLIADVNEDHIYPKITFAYFVPDARKDGGSYEAITEKVRRVDVINRQIELCRKVGIAGSYMRIDMDKILNISGELVDYIE